MIMKAYTILFQLIRNSECLENIGYVDVPETEWHDFLQAQFGEGTRLAWGEIEPKNRYLYAYGDELRDFDTVSLTNDWGDTISLVKVDV